MNELIQRKYGKPSNQSFFPENQLSDDTRSGTGSINSIDQKDSITNQILSKAYKKFINSQIPIEQRSPHLDDRTPNDSFSSNILKFWNENLKSYRNSDIRLFESLKNTAVVPKVFFREVLESLQVLTQRNIYMDWFIVQIFLVAEKYKVFPRLDSYIESCKPFIKDLWENRSSFDILSRGIFSNFSSELSKNVSKFLIAYHDNPVIMLCSIALILPQSHDSINLVAAFGLSKACSLGFKIQFSNDFEEGDLSLIDIASVIGCCHLIPIENIVGFSFQIGNYERALKYLSICDGNFQNHSSLYDRCLEHLGLLEEYFDVKAGTHCSLLDCIVHESDYNTSFHQLTTDQYVIPSSHSVSRIHYLMEAKSLTEIEKKEIISHIMFLSSSRKGECAHLLDRLLTQHYGLVFYDSKFWKAYTLCHGLKYTEGKITSLQESLFEQPKSRLFFARYIRIPLEHPYDQTVADFEKCIEDPEVQAKATISLAKYLDNRIALSHGTSSWEQIKKCLNLYIESMKIYKKLKLVVAPRILTLMLLNDDRFSVNITRYVENILLGFTNAISYHVRSAIYLIVSLKKSKKTTFVKIATSLLRLAFLLFPHSTSWYCLQLRPSSGQNQDDDILLNVSGDQNLVELWKTHLWLSQCLVKISNCRENQVSELLTPLRNLDGIVAVPSFELISLHRKIADESTLPKILGVTEYFEIMRSLQKPKKIWFITSCGVKKPFLCKVNDELRKDNRVLALLEQFNTVKKKEIDALNTYSATPLSDEAGLIEWVEKTKTIRYIINTYLARRNLVVDMNHVKAILPGTPENLHQLIEKYPAVLHEFYHESFLSGKEWLAARRRYTTTVSILSLIGFLIGLGDRHTENILLSSNDGSVLHVDYSCVIDKAKEFDVPEVVPFRLTQNMIKVLLRCNWKGTKRFLTSGGFVASFSDALETTRKYECEFLSLLESFIVDPLLEWRKTHAQKKKNLDLRQFVSDRINGCWLGGHNSCSARVVAVELCKLATDENLLSRMYYGWAAFL